MADRIVNTGFDPEFGGPLGKFRDFLRSKGIETNIISGVRDDEDQRQLVANRNATLARRPLPYPDRGPVYVAAPVGSSAHEYGEAADVQPVNPADAARMHKYAQQFGLQMPNWGGHDPYHVQLANWQEAAATQPPNTPWDQTNPANVPSRMAMNMEADGPSQRGGAPDFYNTAMMHESGGQNIPNAAGGAAGGYYQFMPPTWAGIRAARPDLNLPENAMAASRDQQTAAYHELAKQNVAALQNAGLPISDKNAFMASFLGGGGASKFLNQMGRDPNANAAALFPAEAKQNPGVFYANGKPRSLNDVFALETAKFGTGNTTGFGPNSTPGITLTSVPAAVAGGPAAAGAATDAGTPAAAPAKFADTPAGKSLASATKAFGGGGGSGGNDQPASVPPMQLAPPMASGGPMMMGAGGQNSFGQRAAQQMLAQQGFQTQPSLQYGGANAMPSPIGAPSPGGTPIGAATGIPGLPGTTLNSPSQLQMALMMGQWPYAGQQQQDPYGGMNYG